ncbi:hypothetical protein CLHUN_09810 [Ruminiclostridium hungatei]|uniref:HTH-type transcriptional regulator MT1864/Rv1816-like C-terminal domain-containing protein n=1 Tax=Ruminiclostridium hungatei TaxID=48256 RepID=A0A1V4SMP4_RUMHU|nr:WHG domain-containing protein [Ruminiclostridium hungatei]OPX45094.1 hypothetical protein CLHUN_09810 [Ruminiclostridium hungatei]
MPPKIKIFKENIIEAAFTLTRERGWEYINARSLALQLACSTQPIFRVYKDMAELKRDLFSYAEGFYNEYIQGRINPDNIFLSIGMAYISFAKEEPNLFRMIFMNNHFKVNNFIEMTDGDENAMIAAGIAAANNIGIEDARLLYAETWLFTHGIASMLVTNSCAFQEKETEQMLRNAFTGFLRQIREARGNG